MSRLLFWLALAFLVVAAIRSKLRDASRQQQMRGQPRRAEDREAAAAEARASAAPAAPSRAQPRGEAETMLCCAHCGVYFPASEAVQRNGSDFCSAAHAQLAAH